MMYVLNGMKVLHNIKMIMKFLILFFVATIFLSCKSNSLNRNNVDFSIDDTMFENRESMLHTINTHLHSLKQEDNTLVIYNGKNISLKRLNYLKTEIDSSYNIRIYKNKDSLKKFNIKNKYNTLILIRKSP